MRCDRCQGSGKIVIWVGIQKDGQIVRPSKPCDDCGGSGITSCCDGAAGGKIQDNDTKNP